MPYSCLIPLAQLQAGVMEMTHCPHTGHSLHFRERSRVVKWYHRGLWNPYFRFESWPASFSSRFATSLGQRAATVLQSW